MATAAGAGRFPTSELCAPGTTEQAPAMSQPQVTGTSVPDLCARKGLGWGSFEPPTVNQTHLNVLEESAPPGPRSQKWSHPDLVSHCLKARRRPQPQAASRAAGGTLLACLLLSAPEPFTAAAPDPVGWTGWSPAFSAGFQGPTPCPHLPQTKHPPDRPASELGSLPQVSSRARPLE